MLHQETACPYGRESLAEHYHPFSSDMRTDPSPFYAQARDMSPVFYSSELACWVVTRYDDVQRVLTDALSFSSRDALRPATPLAEETLEILRGGYGLFPTINTTDTEEHKRLRAPLNTLLHTNRVQQEAPAIEAIAHRLLETLAPAGEADMITQFAQPFAQQVILALLGIAPRDRASCQRSLEAANRLVSEPLPPEEQAACARTFVRFQRYLGDLLDQADRPRNDGLGLLLADTTLEKAELVRLVVALLFAGYIPMSQLIGNALYWFLHEQAYWQAICAHPEELQWMLQEVLRYDSPAHSVYRTAMRDVHLGGQHIPKGAVLLAVLGSAHRDERYFPDADLFSPQRSLHRALALDRYLYFGRGSHRCPGASLARTESVIALRAISERFPHLALQAQQSFTRSPNLQFRGFTRLNVTWEEGKNG